MKKITSLFTALVFALGMMATDVLSIDFTQGQGNWTINDVNLGGLSAVWQQTSNYGMKATGYVNGNHETESWLVSPVFDLSEASSYATLSFSHARKYGDLSQLHVIATTNSSNGWVDLSVSAWPDGSSWNFIDATADLSDFIGSSTVQVAFVYTSTTSAGPTWEIKTVNVSADIQSPVYYLVGSMNNWGPTTGYQFTANPNVAGEYMLDVTLNVNDEIKVVKTLNGTIDTWYPDGVDNNYVVSERGNYTVYFRPDGTLAGGYYGYFYPEKQVTPRYDVAEAIAAGLQENDEVEVRGVVTKMEIKGTNFARYGSVIMYVADANGQEGEFTFYNCYSLNADTFRTSDPAYEAESTSVIELNSVSDANGNTVHVGDIVIAYGKYQFYNNTKHELQTGCYLVDVRPAPQDIYINATSGLKYTDNTSTYGWWDMFYVSEEYTIEISNLSSTQAPGTYSIEALDSEYSYITYSGGSRITFVAGSVTLSDNSGTIVVSGTLTGSDGNNYHIYLEYVAPVAQTEATVVVPEAAFDDTYWTSDGLYRVYGMANDTIGVILSIWSETKPGSYTEDYLYYDWSYVYLNEEAVYVYDADIIVVENADGSYTVNADLLCENNTLYHVTMTVPASMVTAIDNATVAGKAVKRIENGTVVIYRNGVKYNINGQRVR